MDQRVPPKFTQIGFENVPSGNPALDRGLRPLGQESRPDTSA
jgi:hypothetical protein